jgi:SpoVK/Ycf46/Vps4 family AAA+-type ATPase
MFDEADALFGKRTSVSDAHDRYANIEVSYLLQRIEAFRGILVLTTNMQANIDAAFVRRLQFIVEFAFPDAAQREQIWRVSVPAQAPRDADLDFQVLAQRYAVAGGSIRNIALSAAMLAAGRGEHIAMRHMAHGAHREYRKLGKALPDGDYFSSGAPR